MFREIGQRGPIEYLSFTRATRRAPLEVKYMSSLCIVLKSPHHKKALVDYKRFNYEHIISRPSPLSSGVKFLIATLSAG